MKNVHTFKIIGWFTEYFDYDDDLVMGKERYINEILIRGTFDDACEEALNYLDNILSVEIIDENSRDLDHEYIMNA